MTTTPEEQKITARFVRVGVVEDPFAAERIAEAIEEAGLDVVCRARREGIVDTLVMPAGSYWEILVPEADVAKATELFVAQKAQLGAEGEAAAQAADEEEQAGEAKS